MCSKAEDAGGLTPAKDDNAAARKTDRKDWTVLKLIDYNKKKQAKCANPGVLVLCYYSAFNTVARPPR